MAAAAPSGVRVTPVPPDRTWLSSRERAFMLGSLFEGTLDLERLRSLAGDQLDWWALASTARPLGLTAALLDAVQSAGVEGALPPDLLARIETEARYIAAKNSLHAHVAAKVHRRFAEAGIRSLALKGTALAHHAPRYFSLRYQADLDVLVEPSEVSRAAALLLAGGFTHADLGPAMDGRLFGLFGEARLLGHHLPPLVSPEAIAVELHHELPGHLPAALEEGVWARAVQSGSPVGAVPSAVDLLGILCAHVLAGHHGERRFLLRHVADLQALAATGASLEEAEQRYGPSVAASARLLEETRLAVRRPGIFRARGAEEVLAPPWWPWTRLRRALVARGATLEAQVGLLASIGLASFFPSPAYMAERYGVARGSPLLPLTYLWRPVRALLRLVFGR
jgi:hypothetical protein